MDTVICLGGGLSEGELFEGGHFEDLRYGESNVFLVGCNRKEIQYHRTAAEWFESICHFRLHNLPSTSSFLRALMTSSILPYPIRNIHR